MSHYAKVLDGRVINVIVAEPEFFNTFVDTTPGTWLQTSYNTRGNVHLNGGTALRGNYAGIGHTYDRINDVFYSPSPHPSWVLNTTTWLWEAPTPMPTEGGPFKWDEASLSWVPFTPLLG